MLTNSDLKQILDALARYGKKDSQLDAVPIDLEHPEGTFTTNDYLSIVQDGKNKTIKIKNLEKVFLLTFLTDEDFREALKGRIPGEMLENASVTTEKLADGSITTIKLGDSSVTNAKLSDNAVTSSKLADNSVTANKIVNESVTASKLNTNAVTTDKLADGSVTTDKIANGAVTSSKIADNSLSGANFGNNTIEGTKIKDNSIPGSKLADGAIESIDIKDGTLSGSKLADNSVTGAKLQDSVITGMKIADNSIPGSKIADSTIQNLNIANGSISGSKLVDNAITTDKIANGAINSVKLANDAITENKIADDSVTTNKIADRAVTNSKLANNSVTSDKIADNSVTSSMITDYAVTENKLDNGSVTASKIAPNAVTTTKLGDNAITSDKIVDGSVTEQKLADKSVTTDKIDTDAVTNVKIADNAVTESKIATNAITTAKIADSSVTTIKIADNTVTTVKLTDGAVTEGKLADGAVTTTKLADGLISEIQNITDATPTEGSVKPVQSGGVKTAIDNVAFSTNEKINEIGITQFPGDSTKKLMNQKAVTDYIYKMQPQYVDEKTILNKSDLSQTLTPNYINDKYISVEGVVTNNPSIGFSRIDCIAISEGDIVDMRFILHKVNTNAFTAVRFAYFTSLPQTGDQGVSNGYIEMPTPIGTYDMEKEFVAPITGYLGVSYNHTVSNPNTSNHITDANYNSYAQEGRCFVFDGKIGQLKENAVNTLEDAYIDSSGQVKSFSTPNQIHLDRIKVSAGDRVFVEFDINKTNNNEFTTCRFAYFDNLPTVNDNCIANTLSFIAIPLSAGTHHMLKVIVVPVDGYLGISYKYATADNTSIVYNFNYHIINYGSRVGKMVSLGDSITYGYIPHGLNGNPDGQLESYAKVASDIFNLNFINYGISGNYLIGNTAERYAASMCSRFGSMDDDADIITFMGGTNDIRGGVPLGTMSDRVTEGDTNTYTYYAGLHKLIEGLYRKYVLNSGKTVKLIGITLPKMVQTPASTANGVATLYPNFDKWADAFKEVCAYYGIPVCDFFGSGLIAAQLASTWKNTAYSNTGYFNPLIPDGVHPSAIGQQYLGEYLANFISRL